MPADIPVSSDDDLIFLRGVTSKEPEIRLVVEPCLANAVAAMTANSPPGENCGAVDELTGAACTRSPHRGNVETSRRHRCDLGGGVIVLWNEPNTSWRLFAGY